MFITHSLKIALSLIVAASAGAAVAGEVPAAFDPVNCKVDYPRASLLNEEQGTVSLSFLVAADGHVLDSKVDRTSGHKVLDRAALKTIAACKFKPGSKDGKVAETWAKVDYAWKL